MDCRALPGLKTAPIVWHLDRCLQHRDVERSRSGDAENSVPPGPPTGTLRSRSQVPGGDGSGGPPNQPPRPAGHWFSPDNASEEAGWGGHDFEAKLGEVLTKFKTTDIDDLSYVSASKPVDFEHWVNIVRVTLESNHSTLVSWWGVMYANARHAYEQHLQLSPLQRSEIHPGLSGFNPVHMQIERYMRRHVLRAMPNHIQQASLPMYNVS